MTISKLKQSFDQHSVTQSFLLHILPGILVTGIFLVLKPIFDSSGYPPLLAFLIAIIFIDIPFMLGVMLYEGKKLNGQYGLNDVGNYREKVNFRTFALVFVIAFGVVFALITVAIPIAAIIKESAFSWLPSWFFLEEPTQYEVYAKNILISVFALQLVITGIVLPWVEELYFRGFLLPRISRFGKWAPLLGGIFFGLYHVWQLFDFPTVFLLGAALGYVVWWKKDIRIGIALHIFANSFARLTILMGVLAM